MIVRNHMKKRVVSITTRETVGRAAELFVTQHVGILPVVDDKGRLVGVLQLHDLLALVMPDFIRLVEDIDFVGDFGAVESRRPSLETVSRPITKVMQPPVAVEDACGLSRAFALLNKHDLNDLPVVDAENRLVGIASRVDIGTALLAIWHPDVKGETR